MHDSNSHDVNELTPTPSPAAFPMSLLSRHLAACIAVLASAALVGCVANGSSVANSGVHVRGAVLNDAANVTASDQPVALAAAKNERVNLTLQISGLTAAPRS